MKRKLILKGPEDALLFKNLLLGFLAGKTKDVKNKEGIHQISRIKKALFLCGKIKDVPIQVDENDPNRLDTLKFLNDPGTLLVRAGQAIYLKDGENIIELYQNDWDTIEKNLVATIWSNYDCDVVADLFDRISTAEQLKDEK